LDHYAAGNGWHPLLMIAAFGACIIGAGIACQVIQVVVSVRERDKEGILPGDVWTDGRTLEWSIPTPAPYYNFAVTPVVHDRDAYWDIKENNKMNPNMQLQAHYADIHMPKNTGTGFIIAMFSGVFGFGMVWHIPWMIGLGLIGVFATVIARTFNNDLDYYIKGDDVMKMERDRINATRHSAGSVSSAMHNEINSTEVSAI
jgi:cytochrome o ubiquinol oxidase subunit I